MLSSRIFFSVQHNRSSIYSTLQDFIKKEHKLTPPNTSPTCIRKSLWYLCYQQKHKQFWFMYRFFHSSHHCGIWMTLQIFNSYNNVKEQCEALLFIFCPKGTEAQNYLINLLIKQHKLKQKIRYWMLIYWIPVYCLFHKIMPVRFKKKKKGFIQKPPSVVFWPELYNPDKIISKVPDSSTVLEIMNFL